MLLSSSGVTLDDNPTRDLHKKWQLDANMANEGASFVCTMQEQVLQHTISTFVHSRGLLFKSGRFPVCKCAVQLQLQSAERKTPGQRRSGVWYPGACSVCFFSPAVCRFSGGGKPPKQLCFPVLFSLMLMLLMHILLLGCG